MKKMNFTESELNSVKNFVEKNGGEVSVTGRGNLKMQFNEDEWFVLYTGAKTYNGYLLRRVYHATTFWGAPVISMYPLNAKYGKVSYRPGHEYLAFSGLQACTFDNVKNAMTYFKKYLSNTGRIAA